MVCYGIFWERSIASYNHKPHWAMELGGHRGKYKTFCPRWVYSDILNTISMRWTSIVLISTEKGTQRDGSAVVVVWSWGKCRKISYVMWDEIEAFRAGFLKWKLVTLISAAIFLSPCSSPLESVFVLAPTLCQFQLPRWRNCISLKNRIIACTSKYACFAR